jgi:hypothetical protein
MTVKSDCMFTIPLEQHSPFIHFQVKNHRPINELIRVSELKPLVERFIKHYCKAFDQQLYNTYKECIEKYFPENSKKASAYKINVSADEIKDITTYKKNNKKVKDTAYFGDYHELKYTGLTLTLFSYHKEVLKLLQQVIPIVLSVFNLGTRKSKGFGSFTPEHMKEDDFNTNLIKLYKKENIYVKSIGWNHFRSEVNKTYQLLKSGINRPYKSYEKSKLYDYFMDKGIRWEKAALKRNISKKVKEVGLPWVALRNTSGIYPGNENTDIPCSFVRTLLGLAGSYTFLNKNKEMQYEVTVEHEKIKRIPSPILFKVFEQKLYAISVWEFYKEAYKNILGQTFKFNIMNNNIEDKNSKKNAIQLDLATPKDFDLQDFLTRNLLKMGYTKILRGLWNTRE